jgi:tetratricopeptide (TPR) repeat protein
MGWYLRAVNGALAAQRGREAHEAKAWEEAYAFYRAAEEAGAELDADDLERMAMDAWLIGEKPAEIAARAFDAFVKEERIHDAVRVAGDLSDYHAIIGDMAQAIGWARRMMRTVEDAPEEGPGHARAALLQAFLQVIGEKLEGALDLVEKGHALARKHGDEDAEALSLSRRAALLMRYGRVEEATADVDEAMLLVNRERTRPVTGAMIYCNTIDFCRDLGDLERALEWTDAAKHYIDERRVCGFPGLCRVHRAELLRLCGEHQRAAEELRAALRVFEKHRFVVAQAYALTELGHLRLEAKALDAAEQAFHEADEFGLEPLPGLAQLALERGDAKEARALLDRRLGDLTSPLGRARLLPTLVTACIELGDLDAAERAANELAEAASRFGTLGIEAHAHTSAARLHLARDEASRAVRAGRNATRAWTMLGACYELVQARALLADAYEAVGDTARAQIERSRVHETLSSITPEQISVDQAGEPSEMMAETITAQDAVVPPPLADSMPLREGRTLDDKIEIGAVLGVGGMGVVHAGRHRITGRDVAVKILKRRVCGDSEHCKRFLSEARACGRIKHPNVVDIYDAGMHGDEPYIVMELLEGHSLEGMLADGEEIVLPRALEIIEEAARGVAAAHEAGVIHRDLKPGNIFVSDEGVKVLDFGISRQPEGGETKPGQILGTPFYMAPEQIQRPDQVDARTDVYALGVVLFELLTGEPPFVAEVVHALLYAITNGPDPDLRAKKADVPEAVEQVVLRALARDQDARFASAAELADALNRVRAEL